MSLKNLRRWPMLVVAGLLPLPVSAGCGSAVCSINTDWDAQGTWAEPGVRVDLRYEFIDQDQPMSGSSRVNVGEIPLEHDEIRTINRNWIATIDYAFGEKFGVSVSLPFVDRSHSHIHNDVGGPVEENWGLTQLGDIRVLGRYQPGEPGGSGFGLLFGAKLPTGDFKIQNADGELAERTLQPGTGTTDALFGAYYRAPLATHGTWFAQVLGQSATGKHEEFRPGDRIGVDLGYRHPIGENVNALLQMNFLHRDRDSGLQSEPDDSGGRFAFIAPGLSYKMARETQLYGFVQVPVYQYVNGVQLTADMSVVAGFATRF
ncbi:MAG: hypothetical protein ABL878_04365 [Burkholderiales bacterium]